MDEAPFVLCQLLHDGGMQKTISGYQLWPCREPDFRSLTKGGGESDSHPFHRRPPGISRCGPTYLVLIRVPPGDTAA